MSAIDSLMRHRLSLALGFAAVGSALLAWSFYRRQALADDDGHTAHLRLSSHGLAQREGFGPVRFVPWIHDLRITFAPADKGMYLLAASRPRPGRAYRKRKMQWPIAFQFECSSEQALVLCHMLERYDATVISK